MDINILEILSYTVVTITVLTMIFGVIAYSFYKIRESRRNAQKDNAQNEDNVLEKDEYLFFDEKEIL
jgi:heme/copper-type cytochrome/quinol oxidase subunit 2